MRFPARRSYPPLIPRLLAGVLILMSCTTAPRYTASGKAVRAPARREKETRSTRSSPVPREEALTGIASYYGKGFHGKTTANGETYNMYDMTAAHKTLPFNTRVKVVNLNNGKSVTVRINDRGPYKKGRIIDLSVTAAEKIDLRATGTARVRLEVIR